MFGLMKAKKCGMSETEKNFRRLNYCGTCKTIGSLYGQKSRFLLNHDTVFLAEILAVLSDEKTENWQKSYQSFNCLNLPKSEMPISLQFAATANLILTKFKLADHLNDEGKRRYRFADKAFSNEFQKAETLLKDWNFPLEKIQKILQTQEKTEAESKKLNDFPLPTAKTTAAFFAYGVKLIGQENLQKNAYKIGFNFGKLIYLLDAFEDYEKDFRRKKFNAFRVAFDLHEEKFSADSKRKIAAILHGIESKIIEKINELPIAESQKTLFISRLSQNLQRKLKTQLLVLKTKNVCAVKPKLSFAEKWQNAKTTAKSFAKNYAWQMPFVFIFVFVFALVAPARVGEAKSARECFDLSFNLMFLGAIFGSVLSYSPLKMVAINHKNRKKQSPNGGDSDSGNSGESWCECCCCDCGDGCDCCCDLGGCDCCGDSCCGDCDCCGSCDCDCS